MEIKVLGSGSIATGVPVILFAWLIAYIVSGAGSHYIKIKSFEYWFRRIIAALFIGVGSNNVCIPRVKTRGYSNFTPPGLIISGI
ncbi:MAG: hypothetical protein K9H49_06955 [Bacteroidales bacterium]|nr:hypothetical protein [Bacteroidales bacterium]MCF8404131.1 hypothetical protein [Bacteroidales bacterium]